MKTNRKMTYNQEKKQSTYSEHKMAQMLQLLDEEYKAATISMLKNFIKEERKLTSNNENYKKNNTGPGRTQKYKV